MSESVAGTVASNSLTIQTMASGRGHGRSINVGGRTNRNRNNRNNNRSGRPNPTTTKASSFKGSTPDMNGHVFECYEERGDRTQFPKTLEALGEYAAKKLKFPEDLKSMFAENMAAPALIEPDDLDAAAPKREQGGIFKIICLSHRGTSQQPNDTVRRHLGAVQRGYAHQAQGVRQFTN
jgi:hypothetical protein